MDSFSLRIIIISRLPFFCAINNIKYSIIMKFITSESDETSSIRSSSSHHSGPSPSKLSQNAVSAPALRWKREATMAITAMIQDQHRTIEKMDQLMDHTRPRLEGARKTSHNATGILVFTKSMQKYEEAKAKAEEAISQLEDLVTEVRTSKRPIDIDARTEAIRHPFASKPKASTFRSQEEESFCIVSAFTNRYFQTRGMSHTETNQPLALDQPLAA